MHAHRREARFAATVKTLRERRGWTQTDLANAMRERGFTNFHQPTIQRIETAERPVRLDEAYALADVFDADLDLMASSPAYLREGELIGAVGAMAKLRSGVVAAELEGFESLDMMVSHLRYEFDRGTDSDHVWAGLELVRRFAVAVDAGYKAQDTRTVQEFMTLAYGPEDEEEEEPNPPGPGWEERQRAEDLLAKYDTPAKYRRMTASKLAELYIPDADRSRDERRGLLMAVKGTTSGEH